jgi:carbamoyltransferase
MLIFGLNACSHDASISVIKDGEIVFAAHSERYSKVKNDWFLNKNILKEAYSFGQPDAITYYEKPLLKSLRVKLFGGNYSSYSYLKNLFENKKIIKFSHHYSHACAGYFTSGYKDAVVVVLDSIGEFETSTIWKGENNKLKKIYSKKYPFSFGLFYSAFTKFLGLKPNEEEYIMMGMAAYGKAERFYQEVSSLFDSIEEQKINFHLGVSKFKIQPTNENIYDIAAAVQLVYEHRLIDFMNYAKKLSGSCNLVFMGGCALNCSANTRLLNMFKNIWIMPNPGDAGSSLGSALAFWEKQVKWSGPYLGHSVGDIYPVDAIFESLTKTGIAAVASGKAEYGPRAFGNRSILADPRSLENKNLVNNIKGRELFRPFAPVVTEEKASEWFDISSPSPYMQYTFRCKKPDAVPAIVHADGTSRVQTVNFDQHSGLYNLLKKWENYSDIPILLNTSLNIKGKPLLNDKNDIMFWNKSNPFSQIIN